MNAAPLRKSSQNSTPHGGGSTGAALRLLRSEDLSPGFGSEPQDVINAKLGDQWDIYIGIMHARFGSHTQHFGSGTEEEFRRAYGLWKEDENRRRLMFYFKKAPVDVDAVDPEQLARVRVFRKELGALGGLYKEFSEAAALKDLLRAHLTSELVELHKAHKAVAPATPSSSKESVEPDADDHSPGILDLIESSAAGMAALALAIEGIGIAMTENTAIVDREGNSLREASASGDVAGMRQSITTLSKSMHVMAKAIAEKRREYSIASRSAFESLSTAISMANTAWPDETADTASFVDTIGSAMETLEGFMGSLSGTERAMDAIPNLARDFSSARLVLKREFASLKGELNTSLMFLRDLKAIAERIGK